VEPLKGAAIAARLHERGIEVGAAQAEKLAAFLNLLEQWNRVHNLTGTRGRTELVDRHLVESLALQSSIRGPDVADIGSGGGLPGIPLAICRPELGFTLIESRRKRVSFLRHVAAQVGLGNVTVAHGRAEALDLPEFATVLARAVAPPAELLALAAPLVAPAGRFVVLTSADKARDIVRLAQGWRSVASGDVPAGLPSVVVVLERLLS
jgi:16S rRNA (guanine527-N7)-methyltransferase